MCVIFFVKQKPAYEMRTSDWSSDVCSSDLSGRCAPRYFPATGTGMIAPHDLQSKSAAVRPALRATRPQVAAGGSIVAGHYHCVAERAADLGAGADPDKQSLAGADTARAAADTAPAEIGRAHV